MEDDHHSYITAYCIDCRHSWKIPLACSNRFCNICHGSQRKRARDRMREVLKILNVPLNYQLKMFTFTIKNQDNLKYMVNFLVDSFKTLRKSKNWNRYVLGGYYVVELTTSSHGWHAHLHVLALSLYYPYKLLLRQWNQITQATGVFIQNIPRDAAISYVTKYVTKTQLIEDDQFEASDALKGRRLYQAFGCFHSINVQVPGKKFECPICYSTSCCILEHLDRSARFLSSA